MDHFLLGILISFVVALSLTSALHALIMKRDPRSALGWIVTSITLPVIGPFFYWTMGVNWIYRTARQWQESGRLFAGWDDFPARLELQVAGDIPLEASNLQELRALSDRLVSSALLSGNCILPLKNGEAAYPAMLAAIDTATRSIHLSTYIFDSDATGRRFADALKSAADRGVEVRVIIDSLGEKYSRPTMRSLLRGSRVKIGRFLPLRQGGYVNLRNHRKILVVDGQIGFTGGMNIGDRHLVERSGKPPAVADMHFRVDGQVVADLQRVFLEDWYFATGDLLADRSHFPPLMEAGNAMARVVGDGPDKEFRKLHWIIMGALACARNRVLIMTPYFIPDRPLVSALITTALRGVDVVLVLPARNNLPFVHWASRAYLWELLQLGIKIYYQPPPFVHTKLFLVDGVWSLIGSANMDPRSLRLNFELDLEVYDADFTRQLEAYFMAAVACSHQVTLAEMDARSLPVKVRDAAAKLFSPYL
ncbi:cardiolipin synthase [Geobacter sp. AOG1]|uniref:cardiolipin synthase n=1 Tax=Geobacter sp. AOG1 TaxID=1566346 RepID=UPI001CC6E90D|nr:cardiolipin synthase [Geobacter sp. AOG1]GFE56594.1 cardiolipin synthase [Geobacter sp. AOG1]